MIYDGFSFYARLYNYCPIVQKAGYRDSAETEMSQTRIGLTNQMSSDFELVFGSKACEYPESFLLRYARLMLLKVQDWRSILDCTLVCPNFNLFEFGVLQLCPSLGVKAVCRVAVVCTWFPWYSIVHHFKKIT